MSGNVDVTAIVPVGARHDASGELAGAYLHALSDSGKTFELLFVLDGDRPELEQKLVEMAATESRLRVIQLAKQFGEAAALMAGVAHTSGSIILTLPAYYQIQAAEIHNLISAVEADDVAVGNRWPRASQSKFEVIRRKFFHWLVALVTGETFSDLGCGARALKREVLEEIPLYGEQHRFLPVLALRRGFHVRELQVAQSERDRYEDGYGARIYLRRLLDILNVLFLVRFTKKPLRFFGMIGGMTMLLGGIFLVYIVIERLFFDVALGDRPALLLSSLLVVLGLQMLALGLLGELIIFTHARDIKEYAIEKIVN